MREIKFRAWDKEKNIMYYNETPDKDAIFVDTLGAINCWLNSNDTYLFLEYTGLKDKNGKKIFAGDIIEHWGERYTVPSFYPLSRNYEADNIKPYHQGSDDWISCSDVDWEVIGNIHENPELLEG